MPLDGMVFVGQMGEAGKSDIADELHFRDGKFWSTFCVSYGLPPGSYTAQRIDDHIVFQGVLTGKPGEFVYEGKVVGGKLDAQVNWTKSRWYWTIERELEFVGGLKGGNSDSSEISQTDPLIAETE